MHPRIDFALMLFVRKMVEEDLLDLKIVRRVEKTA